MRKNFDRLQTQAQGAARTNTQLNETKVELTHELKSAQAEVKQLMASQDGAFQTQLKALSKSREKLRALEMKIENASSELDGKISKASQFKTIQKMLATKNTQIKTLQAQLA